MKPQNTLYIACSAAVASLLFAGNASAQSSGAAPTNRMEEIVVTANKRNESAMDVGSSITAFTGDSLENRFLLSPEDIAQTVPSLELAPSTHGTPVYTLRGIGYNSDAMAIYPAVSISMDQAPMAFPILASRSMYDLERVEVLKGPQGTLFGQNSTGGAINYIAAKPTEEFAAQIRAGYGRFNDFRASGFISGPLSDTVGARLAIDSRQTDEWQKNYLPGRNDENGTQEYFAARFLTEWQPTDRLNVMLNINGSVDDSQPQALQIIASIPSTPAAPFEEELQTVLAPNDNRAANWSLTGAQKFPEQAPTEAAIPRGNRETWRAILRADWDVSDTVTLTSITTYNDFTQDMSFDLDGSNFEMIGLPNNTGSIEDFHQELRLSNGDGAGSGFRWTVGGNYNTSDVAEYQDITYGENSLASPANNFIHISGVNNTGEMDIWALFANGEFDIGEKLTLIAGVRYTDSTNDNSMCNQDNWPDQKVSQLFTLLGNLLGGQDIFLDAGDCYSLRDDLLIPQSFDGVNGGRHNVTLAEDNTSWKLGVNYSLNQDTLLYANVSRGYKAGSFPVITGSLLGQFDPAVQEAVTAYEAGFKTSLAGQIQWSGAVFFNDYEDKQIQGSDLTQLFGLLQRLDNVPDSEIFGFETDILWRPTSGLTLTAAATYLDTEINEYQATNVFGVENYDFAGSELPFAPEFSAVGDIDYQMPLASGGTLSMGATLSYRSSVDAYPAGGILQVPDNGVNRWTDRVPFEIDSYTLLDARLAYAFPGDRMTISAWAKNATDEFYATNVISYNNAITRTVGMPRTYGVAFTMNW
jgi:outer membrane receptor protein involved in Fe transport